MCGARLDSDTIQLLSFASKLWPSNVQQRIVVNMVTRSLLLRYGIISLSLLLFGRLTMNFWIYHSGGGIAGLVLAIALQEFSAGDIRVNVYESAKKFTEIGAGVGLYKRPWKVMKRLGLKESLGKLTKVPESEDKPSMFRDMGV